MNMEDPPAKHRAPCCGDSEERKRDWVMLAAGIPTAASLVLAVWEPGWLHHLPKLDGFVHAVAELLGKMWWGLALGITAIGILSHVPRDWISAALGRGVWRAIGMGLVFDLCSHGILMVGAKLYERGATIGQTLAFLVASPWNSFSLTLILIGLIGLKWTLTFIALSALVGFATGTIADWLVRRGRLPDNPNRTKPSADFQLWREVVGRLRSIRWRLGLIPSLLLAGLRESRMLIRWLLLGVVLASLLRIWVPDDLFATWFGATWAGLVLTMVATTVIEICSEGSSPIAADLVNRAGAPGNGFAFLMGGVATDYTELMVLREATRSWRLAFALPLITVPQVVIVGWAINQLALAHG